MEDSEGFVDKMEAEMIEDIAELCHEINRAYCLSTGDTSQPKWKDAPDWQKLSARQGVKRIIDGEITTPEQSHASWSEAKVSDGWIYGPVKDPDKKEHPCLVSWDVLPSDQKVKDYLFITTVKCMLAEDTLDA